MYGKKYNDKINIIRLPFNEYVAKCELNKQDKIIIKLSPSIAPTPTSLA